MKTRNPMNEMDRPLDTERLERVAAGLMPYPGFQGGVRVASGNAPRPERTAFEAQFQGGVYIAQGNI